MLSVKTGSIGCNAYIIFYYSDPMQLMGSREGEDQFSAKT